MRAVVDPVGGRDAFREARARMEQDPIAGRWLLQVRDYAHRLLRTQQGGGITVDDLRGLVPEPPFANCWGAVFHDKRFRPTGRWIPSQLRRAHGRKKQEWRIA